MAEQTEAPKRKDPLGLDNFDMGLDLINQPIDLGIENIDIGF